MSVLVLDWGYFIDYLWWLSCHSNTQLGVNWFVELFHRHVQLWQIKLNPMLQSFCLTLPSNCYVQAYSIFQNVDVRHCYNYLLQTNYLN